MEETDQISFDEDELLRSAVQIAIDRGKVTNPMLMRFFEIGYTRSGRLMDLMEERKIVGPRNSNGKHEVLIGWDEFEAIFGPRDEIYKLESEQIMKSILEGNTRV